MRLPPALFRPIAADPFFDHNNRAPYIESYMLSIQRQIAGDALLTLSYVGTQGHRLLSSRSANPGNPALCLATPGCGPGGENNVYGSVIGTRTNFPGVVDPTLGPIVTFGNDSYFITAGQSSYNSAQVNYRHTSDRLQLLLGYTYSKAMEMLRATGSR